ncbi:MAG: class I SAM-dependent methyltransferase [Candidatus Moranbacteria bacterium]|nr:class I SAM-dependent methyltransferase [Candidatus Moranbacteria bacterium]
MDYSKTWLYHQTDNRGHLIDAQKRLSFVLKKIARLTNIKDVIDLGFGDGFLLKELAKKNYSVYGIDFVEENISLTKESTGLTDNLKFGSVTDIPFNENLFDLAIATEMFEHLTEDDLEKGLTEIHRVLRKNGLLIVTVPYNENLSKKTVCCPNCECKFHLWGHQQSFNDSNLETKFSKHFTIVKVQKLFPMGLNLNIFGYADLLMRRVFKKYKGYYILLQAK